MGPPVRPDYFRASMLQTKFSSADTASTARSRTVGWIYKNREKLSMIVTHYFFPLTPRGIWIKSIVRTSKGRVPWFRFFSGIAREDTVRNMVKWVTERVEVKSWNLLNSIELTLRKILGNIFFPKNDPKLVIGG
jgi:hypothetical protein